MRQFPSCLSETYACHSVPANLSVSPAKGTLPKENETDPPVYIRSFLAEVGQQASLFASCLPSVAHLPRQINVFVMQLGSGPPLFCCCPIRYGISAGGAEPNQAGQTRSSHLPAARIEPRPVLIRRRMHQCVLLSFACGVSGYTVVPGPCDSARSAKHDVYLAFSSSLPAVVHGQQGLYKSKLQPGNYTVDYFRSVLRKDQHCDDLQQSPTTFLSRSRPGLCTARAGHWKAGILGA